MPCGLWNPSSQTRDQTHALCSESVESEPLDRQVVPLKEWSEAQKLLGKAVRDWNVTAGRIPLSCVKLLF